MAVPFTPTYGGVPIFGEAVTYDPEVIESRVKITTYPGVPGEQVLNLGASGLTLLVHGVLVGTSSADLMTKILTIFRIEQSQTYADFFCTMGLTWPRCQIRHFKPSGRFMVYSGFNGLGGFISRGFMKEYSLQLYSPVALVP